ncbi:thioredoxin [Exiguobacterium mexicanum]|uniref:thioredoxin n=1 Tax=Exiguobacterium mexicanum TaxID=340146 RepID=UPI0037C02819
MAIKHATTQTFEQEVKEGVVLVDFWAAWCGPCRMIAPVLEELDQEMGDQVQIVKLDVDENPEVAGAFQIQSIPTLMMFKDGQPVSKTMGFQPKEALERVYRDSTIITYSRPGNRSAVFCWAC